MAYDDPRQYRDDDHLYGYSHNDFLPHASTGRKLTSIHPQGARGRGPSERLLCYAAPDVHAETTS
eukprot:20945-Eustigmatos_ZCMA.PRE.1